MKVLGRIQRVLHRPDTVITWCGSSKDGLHILSDLSFTIRQVHNTRGFYLSFTNRAFPLVVGNNDILTRLLMIHSASLLRNEAHESPVENTSSDEGVNVTDSEEVLAACIDDRLGVCLLRDCDIVDETRQWRSESDDKSCNRTPVGRILGGVPVDPMEVVHVRHRDVPAASDVVICYEDARHRSQEDRVATKECQESSSRGKDLPWNTRPGTDECSEQLTTTDVDVLGTEGHQVVGCGDGIC